MHVLKSKKNKITLSPEFLLDKVILYKIINNHPYKEGEVVNITLVKTVFTKKYDKKGRPIILRKVKIVT